MSGADNALHVGEPMPRIASVQPAGELSVSVTWGAGIRAGRTDVVDLAPVIMTLRFYAPLREDLSLFASVTVIEDGTALSWDGGRIDMAATTVERLGRETMSSEDFRTFLLATN